MATMAAMGVTAAAVTLSPSASLRRSETDLLSLALPQIPSWRVRSSSSSSRAISGGRTSFPALHVNACAELDVDTGERSVAEEAMESLQSGFYENFAVYEKTFLTAVIALAPLVDVKSALAVGGEFGLLEGRSIALVHPIVMSGLFLFTVYAGYLGWQWRRVRTIQNEISELKQQVKQIPVAAGDGPPPPSSPLEAKINSLTEERKELVKGGYRDKHFNAGSILLALGVLESIGGCVNTWFRTGKLFPGPHLFAGAGITICWAAAAALVPAMQKGNETARNLHIALNVTNVLLFVWQIPTGWEIVLKVFEFTKWP